MKVKLWAPEEYWNTPPEEVYKIAGGCGPGGFGDHLVPDTMYGLSVKPACRIHDFMYNIGEEDKDKEDADHVFLYNLYRIIDVKSESRILRRLRRVRARTYYLAVKYGGGPAFWNSKNKDTEFREVEV